MRFLAALLLATASAAQQPAPLGVVQGHLVAWEAHESTGELSISTPATVYRFFFDQRTYFERDRRRISITALRKGEPVEILSDRGPSRGLRYARIVHVFDPQTAPRRPVSSGRVRAYQSVTEHIIPRGDLTFAGVVLSMADQIMILRTRLDGPTTILLRPDTRYLRGGQVVQASTLETNTRVFVRAGRNLDNEIEAYQVIWGGILGVGRDDH